MSEPVSPRRQISGMPAFVVVWIGQIVSILATQMTQFALTIWAFEKTQSATALGLVQVFFITPFLIISPIAGAMIDRYNRKLMMMVSDVGAGMATILIFVLQLNGGLEVIEPLIPPDRSAFSMFMVRPEIRSEISGNRNFFSLNR